MKVTWGFPATELSGTSKNSQLVYLKLGGQQVARAKVTPENPRSNPQQHNRLLRAQASKAWRELTPETRAAWENWAVTWAGVRGKPATTNWPAGRNAYIGAAQRRLTLGLRAGVDAPVPLPPPELLRAEVVEMSEPTRFAFKVTPVAPVAGSSIVLGAVAVFVRITPATVHPSRAPYENQLRMICGVGEGSARALNASGETVIEFTDARFGVETGQRFAFEITPVRLEDGVSGKPLRVDCIRR